jgi:hypothetical protein
MVRTTLAAVILSTGLLAGPAWAADPTDASPIADAAAVAVATAAAVPLDAPAPAAFSRIYRPPQRALVLPALYVSLSALQAYDTYSTLTALRRGATEANPLMQAVVGHPTAFIALKAGVTGASIYAAEQLWRRHQKTKAILLMVASNGLMGYVAHHNAGVLRAMR